jgi:hypothetical protein
MTIIGFGGLLGLIAFFPAQYTKGYETGRQTCFELWGGKK